MAEAFIAQYSYNTQIEVTTRDLEATRQEAKEGFSDFVTRWRAKASMMTTRLAEKDQIRMVMRNLQPKLLQKMIVLPLPTFADLHEVGVQIEDAMKQGLIDQEREQPKWPFTRGLNAATSSNATARTSDVGMVTTTTSKTATPFTGSSGATSQPATKYPPRGQRTFTLLYMSLSVALRVLIRKGHLKLLEPLPLPNPLPPSHNPAKYCAFHQQHGHDTDQCFRLRHEIQELIDNKVIAPSEKPNVTTNPLPPHNQPPPPPRQVNLIQTMAVPYDPSIYITSSHLPKPALFIPKCTDLCMVSTSLTLPKPVVATAEDKAGVTSEENENVDLELERSESLTEEAYNQCGYIVSTDQARPMVELPTRAEVNVVWEYGPSHGLDDLAELEEDIANLQFFDEQDPGDVSVNWFDLNGLTDNIG
ncbi:hypothetical protein HYC85_028732 [Camellia sinensis]|uniref:Retrotransposon gag domain-containing protein n=1 Tax=Camellia sinensis TaxID=4442 RepID=A0A7J7FX51_CAMSI|nr:hypothetical protein HYC85_028732 [Camellia sinensis]